MDVDAAVSTGPAESLRRGDQRSKPVEVVYSISRGGVLEHGSYHEAKRLGVDKSVMPGHDRLLGGLDLLDLVGRSTTAGVLMRSSSIDAALTPPEPFSALLFDCDGTLVDSVTAYERAWERAFAAQGRTMSPEWYRARTGLSPAALADAAARDDPTPLDKQTVQSEAIRHFVDLVGLVRSNERVAAVAHARHGAVPMAVVSGEPRVGVQASLEGAGILALFDAVVTVEDVERGKPAPDLYWWRSTGFTP